MRLFGQIVAGGIPAEDSLPDQLTRAKILKSEAFIETVLEKSSNYSVSAAIPKKL